MQSTLMLLSISIKCPAIEVYYTDFHEVDEDTRTIAHCGNYWASESRAGVAYRDICESSSATFDTVASRCCTIQKKINITHPR